jgi:hypothetical protein
MSGAENRFTDDEVAQLDAMFGFVHRIQDSRGYYELMIAAAQSLQWRAFVGSVNDEAKKAAAQLQLVRSTVVGVVWKGRRAIASADSPEGMKAPRALLDEMLGTRGFAGVADGKIMSDAIMKINNGAQAAEGE